MRRCWGRGLVGICAVLTLELVAGCATSSTQLRDLGDSAYSMTKRSGPMASRGDNLKVQVLQEAAAFCSARGKALTVYDTRVVDPDPPDLAFATVQFRCVAP